MKKIFNFFLIILITSISLSINIDLIKANTNVYEQTSPIYLKFNYPDSLGAPNVDPNAWSGYGPDEGGFSISFDTGDMTMSVFGSVKGNIGFGTFGLELVKDYMLRTNAQGYLFYTYLEEGIIADKHIQRVGTVLRLPDNRLIVLMAHTTDFAEPNIEQIFNNIVKSIVFDVKQEVNPVKNQTYRFYNTQTGTHLYTNSKVERDSILSKLPHFNYEGAPYSTFGNDNYKAIPVYRFYNNSIGSHFYTSSAVERDQINRTLPHFSYEGVSFYVYRNKVDGTVPLYRFYNNQTGAHFYTINEGEKNGVIRNLPHYSFEGVAFYVAR